MRSDSPVWLYLKLPLITDNKEAYNRLPDTNRYNVHVKYRKYISDKYKRDR